MMRGTKTSCSGVQLVETLASHIQPSMTKAVMSSVQRQSSVNYAQNKRVFRKMRPGDLIEIDRGKYSHWAVCVGK